MTRNTPRALALVLAPLAVGVAVYVVFRPPGLQIDVWLASCDLALPRYRVEPPRGLRGALDALPSAMWTFSLVAFVGALHRPAQGRERTRWLALAWVFVLGWELGQAAGLLSGTFAWGDLFATFVAATLASACTRHTPLPEPRATRSAARCSRIRCRYPRSPRP